MKIGMMWRVAGGFVVLAVIATWPQAIRLDSIPDNVDSYFSLWRLGWIAHQLLEAPAHLFDGNIFHPERHTLAYSDAMLLLGTMGTPFIRAGVPIVYVYNALVLGSFVAAGCGMFILVRHLTGSALAGTFSGLVFAFAPYRFDHYFHLELLWAIWMPLAFWMMHRTLASGRVVDGLGTGVLVALQILSSIYYGIFLGSALLVVAVVLLTRPTTGRRRAVASLAAGALLAVLIALPYMLPYAHARGVVGERNAAEALLYAAGPSHYFATMPENRLEGGWLGPLGRHEKRLFSGFVALALGVAALWPPLSRTRIAYAVMLAAAVNLSFGPRGIGFAWLHEHVFLFRGLRAPARVGQMALLAIAVLAGFGCARVQRWLAARRWANGVVGALLALAFAEYLVEPLKLTAVSTRAPAVYEWLRAQPRGVVAELPTPTKHNSPFREGEFQFLSTFHWHPLVNGYSGNWSRRYTAFVDRLQGFPDQESLAALHVAGVTYVLVHERYFGRERYRQVVADLAGRIEQVGRFPDDVFEVAVYRFPGP